MGASNSTSENKKFYSLKAKVDETNSPYFGLAEKVDNKWKITQQFNQMSGMLDAAEIKQKTFEGSTTNIFVFTFNDGTEISQVEFTHNAITHSFINTLASDCNKINTYNLSVYKKQSKSETNGKTYWNGGIGVKVNGSTENLKWSIDPQQAPKKEQVMVNGQPFMQQGKAVYDSSKLNKFWEDVFTEKIANVLKKPTASSAANTTNTSTNSNTSNNSTTESVDDGNEQLPF